MEEQKIAKKSDKIVPSRVFDVALPGKGLPSSSSRPLIQSRKIIPLDPMVTDTPTIDSVSPSLEYVKNDEPTTPEMKEKPEKIIPFEPKKDETKQEPMQEKSTEGTLVAETKVDEPGQKSVSEPEKPDAKEQSVVAPTEEPDKNLNEDEIEEQEDIKGQADAKQVKKIADEEEDKQTTAANVLVESKQYYVPIHAPRARRITAWVVAIVIILTAAGVLGYMLYTQQM